MRRFFSVVKGSRKAIEDSDLLNVLQSEINHELTINRYLLLKNNFDQLQCNENGSLGDFVLEWDSKQTQDVLLRKKCESGEEVAVSALLGVADYEGEGDDLINREVLMKVCIKKPGLRSILQFDGGASITGIGKSVFNIHKAYYIPSPSAFSSSTYRGPIFRSLDPQLQKELKRYLEARGIGESLANYLILYLHMKEQNQYVNWLQKLKAKIAE